MHIAVDVRARDPKQGDICKTTHCVTIFVALDSEGRPTEVPAWQPVTAEDIAMHSYAQKLMDLRKGIEEEMSPYSNS